MPIPRRSRYHAPIFLCPFQGCQMTCKSPGGLTRHKSTCRYNPENIYRSPSPAARSVRDQLSPGNPPHTPSPQPEFGTFNFTPPRTPQNGSPTNQSGSSLQGSPRRKRWIDKGRYKLHVHPYLDGELSAIIF